MSLPFEVDLGFESSSATDGSEMFSEFEGYFDERDFVALGINPSTSTGAKPGSQDKVLMLAARYAAGLPLWHNEDCYDHGPLRLEEIGLN